MSGTGRGWPAVTAVLAALITVAGCRSGGDGSPTPATDPATAQPTGQPTGLGGAAGEQTGTPRSTPPPVLNTPSGLPEKVGSCPYISADDFADLEGSRVGRVTLLGSRPVGCRFYFAFDPSAIVGEITIVRFTSATDAYNAMVRSADNHPEVQSDRGIGDGAVAYQTDLQGTRTWQCVFAKGTSVVTVRTRQPYPALNAFSLARAIAPKIAR